jgi:hypothetical protein
MIFQMFVLTVVTAQAERLAGGNRVDAAGRGGAERAMDVMAA